MSIKFYYSPYSTANVTSGVLAELEHNRTAGPIAEVITLNLAAGEAKTESFLKINPYGLVPTIVHDDVAIWESSSITLYLADLYGAEDGKTLFPPPGPQRGEVVKWIVWTSAQVQAPAIRLMNSMGFAGGERRKGGPDLEAMEANTAEIKRHLKVFDDALEGKKWLLGEQYTIADTHVWNFMRWLELMKINLKEFGNIDAWCGRLAERDVLKKWLENLPRPNYDIKR